MPIPSCLFQANRHVESAKLIAIHGGVLTMKTLCLLNLAKVVVLDEIAELPADTSAIDRNVVCELSDVILVGGAGNRFGGRLVATPLSVRAGTARRPVASANVSETGEHDSSAINEAWVS